MKPQTIFFLFLFMILLATAPASSAIIGDFRTKASGNWNQVTIWEYYNGSTWVAATFTPTFSNEQIDVLAGHAVTVTANVTIDQTHMHGTLTVNSGVTLTVNDGSGTDMAIYNPVTINGTVVNQGTISGIAAEFIFNTDALYQHNKDGGALPDATWNTGSACEITGVTSSASITNLDQSFYHFKWNCPSQTAETNCAGNLQTIGGDFLMINTGASGKLKLGETADYTLTITGNWDQQGGTLNLGGGSSLAYINLSGNFSMSGGKITEMNSSGYTAKITFVKQGIQTYTKTGGTFENNIDFEIGAGTTLDMGNSIVDGSLGLFSVGSSSTIRTSNANGISSSGASGSIQTTSRYYSFAANYHFFRTGSQSTGNGIPSPLNGKLMIGSTSSATSLSLTNGSISINGTLILCSSGLGNSSISSGTVAYGSTGLLEYQGSSTQITTIKEWPFSAAPFSVTINNPSGVTMDADKTIWGTLTLADGSFNIGTHTLSLNGTLVKTSGCLSGGSSSNLIAGGTSLTALDLPDVALNNLQLVRASGLRLIGNVTIWGTATITNGVVTQLLGKALSYMAGSRLKYNGSSNQTTGAEEFPAVSGPPALEVDKTGGSTLNLNFSRILADNLFLTNGILSIGSNTLTLNALIDGYGILAGGSSSNIIFGGTGAATTLPAVMLNNLTINRPQGIFLGGNVAVSGTLFLMPGNLYIESNTLTINGIIDQSVGGNISGTIQSTLIFGPSPASASLPAITVGFLEINRSAGILMNGDVRVENNLTLASGSLSIGSNTLTLNGSLTLSGGSFTGGATSGLVIIGTSPGLSLPSITLQSLTMSRPASLSFTGDVVIENNLSLNAGTCSINGRMLTLNGTLNYSGGILEGGPSSSMAVGGSGSQLTLNPISLQNFYLNRSNGISLTGNIDIFDTFTLINGTISRNGFHLYGPTARLRYNGFTPQTTSDGEFPETEGPYHVQIQNIAGVTLHANRQIGGDMMLDFGSFYLGNHTFTLNGTFIGLSGSLQGGVNSNLIFGPGSSPGQLPSVELNDLTINRSPGVTLNGVCTINGTLILSDGDFLVGLGRTMNFNGNPIAGNPLNFKTSLSSRLSFGGSQPGFIIPSSVLQIGRLTVSNPSGVTLDGDLFVQSGIVVNQRFILNDHVISGTGSFNLLPMGILVIGHPDGVAGNLKGTGPLMLDSNADFEFNGTMDQLTNFLPTSLPNTIRNLIISNQKPKNVTLNSDMTVTGTLEILSGAKFTVGDSHVLTVENDLVIY